MKKIIFLALLILIPVLQIFAQKEKSQHYRNFDFWIGSWKVYKTGTDTLVGYSKTSSILSGYAIKESYEAAQTQYAGTSLNKYNETQNQWEQFWVDNSGLTLHLKGNLQENEMIMQGTLADSLQTTHKITWEKLPNGDVRKTWETSTNNGQSWKILFNQDYRKRTP
jgi:hypothetical protein